MRETDQEWLGVAQAVLALGGVLAATLLLNCLLV